MTKTTCIRTLLALLLALCLAACDEQEITIVVNADGSAVATSRSSTTRDQAVRMVIQMKRHFDGESMPEELDEEQEAAEKQYTKASTKFEKRWGEELDL